MKGHGVIVIAALALAGMLAAAPAVALGQGWSIERSLAQWSPSWEWASPDTSGHWVVFLQGYTIPVPLPYSLMKFDLRTAVLSEVATDTVDGIESAAVDGDWVAYSVGGDIRVKNLVTGVMKKITTDGAATVDHYPAISGKYVVWEVDHGLESDIRARDFVSMHASFPVADGPVNQWQPSIHGLRVAYRSEPAGDAQGQIMVKTIGSSAEPMNLTGNTQDQSLPSIGDHLVAWTVMSGGRSMIRYHNYDTGETLDGPNESGADMREPQVSGDRILFRRSVDFNSTQCVFDVRTGRAAPLPYGFPVGGTSTDEMQGRIAGNSCVYLRYGVPTWAGLAVPNVTVASVPKRIPHNGRIRLKGHVSDQGVALGKVHVRIEKYASGRWVLVTTVTTSTNGDYSYRTAALHAKTKFRVAYDGYVLPVEAGVIQHLSAVSAVRTGWPR